LTAKMRNSTLPVRPVTDERSRISFEKLGVVLQRATGLVKPSALTNRPRSRGPVLEASVPMMSWSRLTDLPAATSKVREKKSSASSPSPRAQPLELMELPPTFGLRPAPRVMEPAKTSALSETPATLGWSPGRLNVSYATENAWAFAVPAAARRPTIVITFFITVFLSSWI